MLIAIIITLFFLNQVFKKTTDKDKVKEKFNFEPENYNIYYTNSKIRKGYSGVCVFTKIKPLSVHYGLENNKYDDEGRIITLEFDHFYYIACYVPNSGDGLKRLEFRLEFEKDMVEYLNKLDIQGIKIHMLSILKDTPIEYMYQRDKFHILTKEEYIDIVCDQLEYIRPEIVIHRITVDPKNEDLIEPTWLLKKFCVLNDIDKCLKNRNSYQGKKLNKENN